ncbi:MAG: protein kinase [Blastocatellia bacterium]|nr:protein kinase [Blastocatellia bacterium]
MLDCINRSPARFQPVLRWHRLGQLCLFLALMILADGTWVQASSGKNEPVADLVTQGRLTFRAYNEKDGLPQNAIEDMGFDQQGFLWVGTQDGAARYNGREWKVVNLPNPASSNFIRTMLVSEDGSLWFGRQDGGLARLQGDNRWTEFTRHNGLPANRVDCLAETVTGDGKIILWAGTSGGGLAAFQDGTWTVYNQPSDIPHNNITSLAVLPKKEGQALWVATPGGVACWEAGHWTKAPLPDRLATSHPSCLFAGVDAAGSPVMWLGFDDGQLGYFHNGDWQGVQTPPQVQSHPIIALAQTRLPDGSRTLWLGLEDAGLARLERGCWEVVDTSKGLPSNTIKTLLAEDTSQGSRRLWIGTDGAGLIRLELSQWLTFNTASGLPANMVFSLLVTRSPEGIETLWAGTNGKGIARLEKGHVTVFDESAGLPVSTAFALLETTGIEQQRIVWAGLRGGGIARFVNGRWKQEVSDFGLETASVRRLIETVTPAGEHELWAATGRLGLAHYAKGRWSQVTTKDGLPTDRLFTVLEAENSIGERELWVGTEGGGMACRKNGKWVVYDQSSGLPNNSVLSLLVTKAADGTPTLWAGTEGGGVARMFLSSGSRTLTVFSDKSQPALPNNTIYQVQADDQGRIYLFTNKGVARLSPRTPDRTNPAEYEVYTFTVEDGLPNNEFNGGSSYRDGKGRIWGGSIGGAVVYEPDREVPEPREKRLTLERLQVNGESVVVHPVANGMEYLLPEPLRYDQNNLLAEFSLLSFFREKNTAYRIRLEGFDQGAPGWMVDFKKEYTNLPAGQYRFEVWGRDAGGTLTGPLRLRFSIRPAPWLTWWAYVTYFCVGGGSLFLGVRWRLRTLEQRNLLLETRIAERTADLARAVEETQHKNEQLEAAKSQVEHKNRELGRKISELLASQQQADRIFSALAEALPGTVLDGKYRLEEKIGAGGFGTVFRGTQLNLNRPVAIKVFRPRPGNDTPESVERFKREGISATLVNHPNAIQVIDSGISAEGVAYIVMELLQGHSLAEEIRLKRRFSLKRVQEIVQPVCAALTEAHSCGIIHRDIKPDNIFLHQTREGEVVKVVDFGLAKLKEDANDVLSEGMTASGVLIGTPSYMSPERLSGKSYDERADVYSVGVVLYELLCGSLPFQPSERGVIDVILRQIHELPQPPRQLNPDLPTGVEQVVLHALEKNPALRPTVMKLEQELAVAMENLPEEILTRETSLFSLMETAELKVTLGGKVGDRLTDAIPPAKKTIS